MSGNTEEIQGNKEGRRNRVLFFFCFCFGFYFAIVTTNNRDTLLTKDSLSLSPPFSHMNYFLISFWSFIILNLRVEP